MILTFKKTPNNKLENDRFLELLSNLSQWWKKQINFVNIWNSQLIDKFKEFTIAVPRSYESTLKEIEAIYHSSLSINQKGDIIRILISNNEYLAQLINKQLSTHQITYKKLLEKEDSKDSKDSKDLNVLEVFDFTEIKEQINGLKSTSLCKYLEMFPTLDLKRRFLHGFVVENYKEMNIQPMEFNKVARHLDEEFCTDSMDLSEEIPVHKSQEKDSEKDSSEYICAWQNHEAPPKKLDIEIPVHKSQEDDSEEDSEEDSSEYIYTWQNHGSPPKKLDVEIPVMDIN